MPAAVASLEDKEQSDYSRKGGERILCGGGFYCMLIKRDLIDEERGDQGAVYCQPAPCVPGFGSTSLPLCITV